MTARPYNLGMSSSAVGSEYTADELEFLRAMQAYMNLRNRRYPTFVEVLNVAKSLGYRRVAPASEIISFAETEGKVS